MYKPRCSSILLLLAASILYSCSKDASSPDTPFSVDIFYKSMNQITIEVAYEEEAVPYINDPTGKNIWEFTEINIESLFVQRPVKVDVKIPVSLNDMTFIPDQDQSNYTTMKYLI